MNIKKIIQEEINDFGWVDEINPTLFEYFENGLLEVGDVVTVRGETLDTDGIPVLLDKGKYLITHLNEFESSNFYKFIRSRVVFDNETQQKLDIYKETSLIEEDKGLEVLDHQRGGTMDMGDNVLREDDGDGLDWVRRIEGPKGEELRELLIGWLSGPFGRDLAEKQINGSTVYYTTTSIDRDSYLSNLYKIVYSNGTTEIVEIDDELNVFSIPWYAEKRITNDENTEWILVLSPQINESDELDWIRELEPKRIEPCVKRGKCKEYVITGLESLSSNKVLEVLSAVNDLGWDTRDFEDWWDYEELCYFYLERRGNCNWDDCELGYHEEDGEYYNYEEITPQDILNVVPQEKGLWGRYIDKLNESDDLDWVRNTIPEMNVDDSQDTQGWWKNRGMNLILDLGFYDFEAKVSSDDWSGYVMVDSNYGYFYHRTDGISEDYNCPQTMTIESVVWGKRKRKTIDISDCTRNPWTIFGNWIRDNAEN
jgi:hypothetical protein